MKLFQRELELGQSVDIGGLTVYPLLGSDEGALEYLAAPEATDVGLVEVSELDNPSVPTLQVTNLSDFPVLFVEGQTLVGGDQNRTMNVSVLVPAKSKTPLPVSCVEAHRWGASTRRGYRRSKVAPGSLRSAKIAGLDYTRLAGDTRPSDQRQVWDEVDRLEAGHQVFSGTAALDDLQDRVEARGAPDLDRVAVQPGQVGVAFLAGGRVVGLDLFDRSSTLEHYLRSIVGGHLVDASLSEPAGEVDGVRAIEDFLAQVEAAPTERADAVGLGEEIHWKDSVNGVGLEVEGHLVHLAAFPPTSGESSPRGWARPLVL